MLDATSIINGRLDLTREPQDLGDIVRETLEDLRGAIERAGCDLLTHLDRSVLGRWDRVRVRQIVANLVSNAIKYGAGRPVEVATYADGQYGVLEVRDHGKGIPEQERERIFGPFERAASIRNYGGLGLGLFVVQQIVAAHGGDVVADNATDGGARLRVRLPLDPEAEMARSPSLPESLACPPPTASSSSRTTN
jgi:signal transduction histidine kinase